MAKEERPNLRKAPMERFIWREGDLRIMHDPREDRARKEDGSLDDAGQAEIEERDRRRDA